MAKRGPLPDPNSGATQRGINSLSQQAGISDPGDWNPETELAQFDWIGDYGKEMWQRVAPILKQAEILTRLDLFAFALLCHFWHEYRTANEQLKETGSTYTTARGRNELHPMVKIEQKYADMFISLATQFGMTPASRKRNGWAIQADTVKSDPFEEFMQRRVSDN